jgi:hypothetical protein
MKATIFTSAFVLISINWFFSQTTKIGSMDVARNDLSTKYKHEEINQYLVNHPEWRLPTIEELQLIYDKKQLLGNFTYDHKIYLAEGSYNKLIHPINKIPYGNSGYTGLWGMDFTNGMWYCPSPSDYNCIRLISTGKSPIANNTVSNNNQKSSSSNLTQSTNCISGDCINGYGVYKYNGGTWEGNFTNGKRNGKIFTTYSNGTSDVGFYENGELKYSMICDSIDKKLANMRLGSPSNIFDGYKQFKSDQGLTEYAKSTKKSREKLFGAPMDNSSFQTQLNKLQSISLRKQEYLNKINECQQIISRYKTISESAQSNLINNYLEALNKEVYPLDQKTLKKLQRMYYGKYYYLEYSKNKRERKRFDFSSSQPIFYEINGYLKVLYNDNWNKGVLTEWSFRLSDNKKNAIKENFIKLDELSKKTKLKSLTGIDDEYIKAVNELKEQKELNKSLTSKNYILLKSGAYYLGSAKYKDDESQYGYYFSGFGILFSPQGDTIFAGNWVNHFPDLKSGKLYQYNNSKTVTYIQSNGEIFEAYSSKGDVYVGEINKSGQNNYNRNGQGIYVWTNDRHYEGYWYDGERTGDGTLYFEDGNIWTGEWKNSTFSGMGKKVSASGSVTEGLFDNGTLIKSSVTIEQERLAEERRKQEELRKKEEERIQKEKETAEFLQALIKSANQQSSSTSSGSKGKKGSGKNTCLCGEQIIEGRGYCYKYYSLHDHYCIGPQNGACETEDLGSVMWPFSWNYEANFAGGWKYLFPYCSRSCAEIYRFAGYK